MKYFKRKQNFEKNEETFLQKIIFYEEKYLFFSIYISNYYIC